MRLDETFPAVYYTLCVVSMRQLPTNFSAITDSGCKATQPLLACDADPQINFLLAHCTSSSTLSSLRRQCLMRDHPLTSSSTPHPRTLSTTSSRPQCVTRCHGGTHRPSEAHTPERSRVGRRSGGGRLPNHRPKRSTTTNKPLRRRSARMAMQARLHARQRRRPRDHRHGPSARQDHHPNTNIHPASNPANHACSTTTLRWPPPRAAHQSLFR